MLFQKVSLEEMSKELENDFQNPAKQSSFLQYAPKNCHVDKVDNSWQFKIGNTEYHVKVDTMDEFLIHCRWVSGEKRVMFLFNKTGNNCLYDTFQVLGVLQNCQGNEKVVRYYLLNSNTMNAQRFEFEDRESSYLIFE